MFWLLQVAHLPGKCQSWRGLHKRIHVSLRAGSPHTWLVSQPLTHLGISQRTWRLVIRAAAMSMWGIELSLSGITRVVWWWGACCYTVIHENMRLRWQPVHMMPLLRLHLVRDWCMPGNVTLVVEMRNRHPSLLESWWSHCDCCPCRWPVALSVGAGLAGGVGVQEYRESRDAVNGSLQRGNLGKSLATEVMVQSDA